MDSGTYTQVSVTVVPESRCINICNKDNSWCLFKALCTSSPWSLSAAPEVGAVVTPI